MSVIRKATSRQAGAAAAVVLTPSLLFVLALWLADPAEPGVADADARCQNADRAATVRIRPLLDQADSQGTRALERAVSTLSTARSHCSYGWIDIALQDYAALERSLQQ
jgi:hypothetical protein